ncbi:hypothetical protein [Candidatus Nitrosopumilus sp. SW]|uniref:hypothetical protein n=1 Tax=Candidatus Nitrosopumilus sp. SW TaxID=2508726 RepID=UPI00163ADA49|nr:hypothetical protein [Candidatus Nitrosopumilus sp. SW]
MSGKDQSVVSKEALMSTKPGKQIMKQGLFKSKGYKLFNKYKEETENEFPNFAERFAKGLLNEIKSDNNPNSTQQAFADEVGSTEIILNASEIEPIKSKLESPDILKDRVLRILNSNFVKMTFPVFNALFDGAAEYSGRNDPQLRQDMVEGHILAIDLSEPMDRIVDKDEDLEYLDDYKLMNPYILKLARDKISKGGDEVLKEFEEGFKDARIGQYLDEKLKSKPTKITEEEMTLSYKKYRAVMGTAGRNMALAERPLGEIFYLGMARAAEGVGCGNEIEDSIKNGFVKIPSWPLYYSLLANDVKKGFEITLEKSNLYLQDARLAIELLPDGFSHKEFLEFLFLTVDHYNQYWYNQLQKANKWSEFESKLPK